MSDGPLEKEERTTTATALMVMVMNLKGREIPFGTSAMFIAPQSFLGVGETDDC